MTRHITIYALVDHRTSKVRYVGAASNPLRTRVRLHQYDKTNAEKHEWLWFLKSLGVKPLVKILEVVASHSINSHTDAGFRESHWIRVFLNAGHRLTNLQKAWRSA